MTYSSRIRTRAAGIENGNGLLEIASRADVRQEMRRRVMVGEKPVTALSEPLAEAFGEGAARNDTLRRLAGEVAAHIVETDFQCVRSSGSHKIVGDRVFTSGQPFRLPSAAVREPLADGHRHVDIDVPELLARHLSDEALTMLRAVVTVEWERRKAE